MSILELEKAQEEHARMKEILRLQEETIEMMKKSKALQKVIEEKNAKPEKNPIQTKKILRKRKNETKGKSPAKDISSNEPEEDDPSIETFMKR